MSGSFSNRLAHAQSTPAGVDGSGKSTPKTPPTTPKKSGKLLSVRVLMLDDSISIFHVQVKAVGRLLFDQVCKQLNLLEADYFGLEYQDSTTKYWLDFEKPLHRQIGLSLVDPLLTFCVKFYTPDPARLEEEYTRYLFCLQIKRDLMQGDLQCNDNTAALIISYIIQAECGDYSPEDYPDHTYLSSYKFVSHQDKELERKVMENHKKHIGQSPAEADLNLLETARRCELYGMKMHPAKDHEGVPLNLAVAHMGIIVFQNSTKINTFSWAKIRKISFRRKRFLIKLHPEGYGFYKDVVDFIFDNRNQCKGFWKKCVENHGFFRCSYVKCVPRQKSRVLSRGSSSFRYSGKTQKQMVEYVRENYMKRQTFQRSQSFRHQNSIHSSVVNVGGSISAHPLLPLGENAIASSGASLSCGSMTLSGSLSPITHPVVGQPTLPTATSQRLEQLQQRQRQQQQIVSTTDVHEPATTSSDITSIASQSPLHDTEDGVSKPNHDIRSHSESKMNGHSSNNGIVNGNQIVVEVETNIPVYKTNGLLPNLYTTKFLSKDEVSIESPVPELKNISRISNTEEMHGDAKKKRPSEKDYFIAKELLVTERTYRKDLEVISYWLRDEFCREKSDVQSFEVIDHLLILIDPIYDAHCVLLREIELRLSNWEPPFIGDIMNNFSENLPLYERYINEHLSVLEEINSSLISNINFERLYREFESQKICYLPLTSFILKPLQRLMHYSQIVEKLLKYYGKSHDYYEDCYRAKMMLSSIAKLLPKILRKSENAVLLYELNRDVVGVDNIIVPHREFIRQGCLSKFSQRKGYQQRMFFLFSDILLYSGRSGHTFRVHGQLPLNNIIIEERPDTPQQHSFSIYGGNRVVTVAANSEEEKDKWLEDLTAAIQKCKNINNCVNGVDNNSLYYFSLKSCNSAEDIPDKFDETGTKSLPVVNQRSNNTVYVCWHRNTSVSMEDHIRAAENQLSGYLLRKFKNSNGWQKLWVVFTNFCLFFYKSFQEDYPLASLPLLGYTVTTPSEKDSIQKDFVFKLQFKNHIYFFRAESEHTFNRWMEVIGNTTQHSGRLRLFSRKDSAHLEIDT